MKRVLQAWYGLSGRAGLLLVLGGCANGLTEQQRLWLARGQDYYEHEDYTRAIDQLSRFLGEVREGPGVARALFVRGMSNAQAGHRAPAYADLRRCAATPADDEITWRAYLVLGTLHFEDRQWAQAAQKLRATAERMPTGPPKDTVLYRLGLCHERTGRWRAAAQFYSEITKSFSGGKYARAAYRRLRLNANHFAVQCGAFRGKNNAETLRDNLEGKGLRAYVRQEIGGRRPLYVVLVGRFADYDEALAQLAMIKRQFVPDAVLWP
ncbi:MAG: SPOR domain-containing protein [Phycisphaerae bacterium]